MAFTRRIILALGLCLAAAQAQAAGLRQISVPADAGRTKITGTLWTPCARPPQAIKIEGTFAIPGVKDCPILGEHLPLVVISHGLSGGSFSHHDTAETLADAGFVVVALNHTLDSGRDMKRADDIASLLIRPTDVKRVLDYMLRDSAAAAKIDPKRIGLFGFSRGGYTALMLAGAVPDFVHAAAGCPDAVQMCRQVRDKQVPAHLVADEPRIKAFVIADPLAMFFPDQASVNRVRAPVQLWASAEGGQGVEPKDVAALARNLPVKPDYHPVPNSTHLSFLLPCTPALRKAAPPMICADPPGFDRTAFHKDFDAKVVAFFHKHLVP